MANRVRAVVLVVAIGILLSAVEGGAVAPGSSGKWRFTVRLDGREIGTHSFVVRYGGEAIEVESQASFDVKLLGFSLYSYAHQASERWQDGCLRRLQSTTNDDGTEHEVTVAGSADGFVLTRASERLALPGCTMTFAYWNPRFREERRLLNPQDGELLDVQVVSEGRDKVAVGGQQLDANRFALRAEKMQITLWYSVDDDRWLALDSTTSGGRRISYRLE